MSSAFKCTCLVEHLWRAASVSCSISVGYITAGFSVFGIFLVRLFPHSDWIRRYMDTFNAVYFTRCEFFSVADLLQFVKFSFSFLVSLCFGQYTYINYLRGNLTICGQRIIYIFCLANLPCVAFSISILQEFSVLKFDMIKMIHAFGNWSCMKDVHSSNPPMFTKICNPYWISNATTPKFQF